MSTVYAEPGAGKTVLTHLKGVAAKRRKKHLGLCAFLEIEPPATHDEWQARLRELSRRFRNQSGKPGHREAVDLCTFLERHFRDEKSWRGLLNQLGRLHVEGRVEQLAEADAPPDLVQQSFNVLAHEAARVVGAPDAEAVVQDLFEEHGLERPKPAERKPRRRPAPPPEPEPEEEAADSGDAEGHDGNGAGQDDDGSGGEGPSVWATLGNLFLNGAVEALKARAEVARHQMASDLEAVRQTVNVAGAWRGEQGAFLSFAQRGVQLHVQGQAMNQAVGGQGIVRGRQVELMVWLMPQQTRLSVLLDVAPDGGAMRGTARDDFGRTMPVNLFR